MATRAQSQSGRYGTGPRPNQALAPQAHTTPYELAPIHPVHDQSQSVAPTHGGPDQAEGRSSPNQGGAARPPGPRPNRAPQAHTTPHELAPIQPVQAQSVAPDHRGPDQACMGPCPNGAVDRADGG